MHPDIRSLLILQEREQRVNGIEDELEKLPKLRIESEKRLALHRSELEAQRDHARKLEATRKRLELEIESKRGLIGKYERQKFETRKNEEYAALGHAIEQETRDITKVEDEELEVMAQTEVQLGKVKEAEAALRIEEETIQKHLVEWVSREHNLKGVLSEAQAALAETEKTISDEALQRYDRIAGTKRPVVVPIRGGACGGCHVQLTSQSVVNARGGQIIASCPSCARLIYWLD
jgi:predicted  nucleic acid-binding Zn-ribbon protein